MVLTTAVPGPTSWASGSFGDRAAASFGGAAQEALLLTAGVIVWTLLAWGVAVGGIAALGHLPGTTGRVSRAVLDRVAPAAAGRLVAATLGVSLLAGTTACAAPVMAGSDPTMGTAAAATSSAAAASTDPAASAEASDGASIDIDWPLTTAAKPAQTPAAPPASSTATSPPVTTTSPPVMTTSLPVTTTSPPVTTTDWPDSAPTGAVAPTPADTPDQARTEPPGNPVPTTADQAGTDQPTDPAPSAPGAQEPPATSDALADTAGGADPPGANQPHVQAAAAVIVRPGDTLWAIAAATLPASSTTSEIDSAWRAWYLTNERVIGNDPDVIRPGQSLLPPTTDAEPSP